MMTYPFVGSIKLFDYRIKLWQPRTVVARANVSSSACSGLLFSLRVRYICWQRWVGLIRCHLAYLSMLFHRRGLLWLGSAARYTIFVVKSSHNLVIYRNLCIFMVLAFLETPHNHCITIVRMITNKVYFNFKNRFVGCSRFINLCSIWSSSGLCAFINHSHLLHYYHHNFQMREKDKLCRNFFIKIK